MNRKKGKRQKIDSGQEILVLPPHLLEKLGINLGKMCGNQDPDVLLNGDANSNIAAPLVNDARFGEKVIPTVKNQETSIIETANLMKKSVFLSPTFNISHSAVISNTLELESTTSLEKLYKENLDLEKNEDKIIGNQVNYDNIDDYCIENYQIMTQSNNPKPPKESKPPATPLNEEAASQFKNDNKNKINILSEEIVNPTKLSTLGPIIDLNNRNALVPIPIDTFISISKHNNDNKKSVNNKTHLTHNESKAMNSTNFSTIYKEDEIIQSMQVAQTNGEISTNNITEENIKTETLSNIAEIVMFSDTETIAKVPNCKPEQYVANLRSMEDKDALKVSVSKICNDENEINIVESKANCNVLNDQNPISVNKNELDTVQTIANILFERHNKKEGYLGKNTAKDNFFTSKQNKAKSKLSVQGVEKPGGEVKLNQYREQTNKLETRTYARNKQKPIKKGHYTLMHAVDLNKMDKQIDHAKDISYVTDVQIPEQFCICFDFGYLDHNIDFQSYVHPHLSNSQIITTPGEVFSIYNEGVNNLINRVDCDSILLEDTSDSDSRICCNAINLDSDIEDKLSPLDNRGIHNNINMSSPKTHKNNINDKSCGINNDNLINFHKTKDEGKAAQVSPEAQMVQNMQLHGFEISDINIDNDKNDDNVVKLIKKKRKLSLTENEDSEIDCHKRKKGRKSSRLSKENLEPVSSGTNFKIKENESASESVAADVSSCGTVEEEPREVRCAVCGASVRADRWLPHASGHAYLAWQVGLEPLDITDKKAVRRHLVNICKELGALTCSKCMSEEKNVESYLAHTKQCKNVDTSSEAVESAATATADASAVRCGVCDARLQRDEWAAHAGLKHNYLAWIHGEPPPDLKDANAVNNHLYRMSKEFGGLTCTKCGLRRKYVKAYLKHMESCDGAGTLDSSVNESLNQSTASLNTTVDKANTSVEGNATLTSDGDTTVNKASVDASEVVCGVCDARVASAAWSEHARTQHDYIAWTHAQKPIDTSDKKAVDSHLKLILRETGNLVCGKCDDKLKSVKSYLRHVKDCDPNITLDSTVNSTLDASETDDARSAVECSDKNRSMSCGVCDARVRRADWLKHTRTQHQYLAWPKGQNPLALDDEKEVYNHLYNISKEQGGLQCTKCGKRNKNVKTYLTHVKSCDVVSLTQLAEKQNLGVLECAVCSEKVEANNWKEHAMTKHYNVAWAVGETPIDVRNPSAAEKCLNVYKQEYKKLKCRECGLVRISCAGFYAHVIQCGKTDEETEMYKNVCEICNNKYLCIYKNQHMAMHREQEHAKQRRSLQAEKTAQKDLPEVLGRRRAAVKANHVIEKYTSVGDDEAGKGEDPYDGAESDASAEISSESSSESGSDSAVESDQSDESEQFVDEAVAKRRKRKKYPETHTSNITRIPFTVKNAKAFIAESVDDIRKQYLSAGELYTQWRCEATPVPAASVPLYMPTLKQSCQVKMAAKEWTTYDLFEARVGAKETSFFVGGCIQWISWAPPRVGDKGKSGNYLAVAAHKEADAPRLDVSAVYEYPSMIQIWDFGDMTTVPRLSLCIALECGAVWAGAWCPSGRGDARVGLLAVASSSGAAYILPVPYPDAVVESENLLYKIKPAAELRFSRGEREKYQATSISWSTEKGNPVVVVGYADGTLGYYHVQCESPLLADVEDGATVYYPYDEEQRHNSCITDVSCMWGGGVCSASQTGAALRMRGAAVHNLLPTACATPLPHWPNALVSGNDLNVTQTNELDCWGAGRRLGPLQRCGGCACCGAVAAVAPPTLRLLFLHPAYGENHKKDIATFQMARLDNKKSKRKNDDLSVVIEPRTYEDAIKTYGVEFKHVSEKDEAACKEQYCERFPLADSAGVAFCPAPAHHARLALALHCGLVVLLTV